MLPVTALTLHGSQLKSVCALSLAERTGTPQGCDTFENPSGKPTAIFARLRILFHSYLLVQIGDPELVKNELTNALEVSSCDEAPQPQPRLCSLTAII